MSLLKHIAVFAIGFAVCFLGGRMLRTETDKPPKAAADGPDVAAQSRERRAAAPDTPKPKLEDYLQAWDDLQQLDPRTAGFIQMRERLIKDWLRDDLPGALSELLLNYKTAIIANAYITPDLVDANEDWIIASARDRRFGLNGRFLLKMLVAARPDAPVEKKWKYVDLLDPKLQGYVFYSAFKDEAGRTKWLGRVEELPHASVRAHARQVYVKQRLGGYTGGNGEPVEGLIASVREMENPETRSHMAKAIMDQRWVEDREKTITLLDAMDGEMYDAALDTALAKLPTHHPPDDLLKHLGTYLDGGHFEAFTRIDDEFLHGWNFDDDQVRNWAWNLPERPESARLIRGSVSRKFARDPDGARDWLAGKNAGWQKDHAMVELARIAPEPRLVDWVLEEISNPGLRAEADGYFRKR